MDEQDMDMFAAIHPVNAGRRMNNVFVLVIVLSVYAETCRRPK
jgi:hypothetical protein